MICDLHMHSTASDGQYSPSELVRLAKARGIEVLALTDHDTVVGVEDAVHAGLEFGVNVLRGVELGAAEYRNLHLLGYNIDPATPALVDLCGKLVQGRNERKYRIIDFLKEKGVPVTLDEVEDIAGGDVIARPHFARAMMRRGYVSTTREAFDRFLDTEEYQRIERFRADAATCISAIKSAGGKVSLAHPYQVGLEDHEMDYLVKTLVELGLDAIECYYPRHTPEQIALYSQMAKRYGLYATGGSDFHGEKVKPDTAMATLKLELDWLL